MKKIVISTAIASMVFICAKLYAPSLTISQPGFYQLSQTLAASPSTPGDALILIAASNVVLDFHGNPIVQNNATSPIDGVRINPGLTDVTIQNGVIRNVTGNGLSVTSSDTQIQVINMMFENCGATGISANGSAGSINNIGISGCKFIGCGSNSTSTTILALVSCIDGSINECEIAGSSNSSTTTFAPCSILSSSLITINDLRIEDNVSTASAFVGLADFSNTACTFNEVIVRKNLAVTSTFNGFLIVSSGNLYSNCLCMSNSNGVNGAFYGFAITGSNNAQNNIFQNCAAMSNVSVAQQGLFGFYIDAPNNSFFNCFALSNTNFNQDTGTTPVGGLTNVFASTVGFYVTGPVANFIFFDACIGANNIGSTVVGNTAGIILQRLNGISSANNACRNGIFFNNLGVNAGVSSRGIISQTNSFSLFTRNVAYQGSTGSAQSPITGIIGTSFTTPTAPATDNMNTALIYWTNLNIIA
ncbi:hypothetical protein HYX58_05995 [Candidatus Dependentiae bacterium]|nr:hypothetical protein [Candidatus Dependentiae bacterium]